ncbi:UNVERIFIED_CONTAM: hypothetical protein GTU68_036762 [Idotea baltica]|nr:hypothetical protein [Idotea baltica]
MAGLLLSVSNAFASTEIKDVRLWRAPDSTRLVFDLSGPAEHKVFTLAAPNRLVLDIKNAQLAAKTNTLQIKGTPITQIRSAQRPSGDLRVVIDLSQSITVKSFSLPPNATYGDRLVVDLLDSTQEKEVTAASSSTTTIIKKPTTVPPKVATSNVKSNVKTSSITRTTVTKKAPESVAKIAPESVTKTVPASSGRVIIVAIDAGHGGEDPGASSPFKGRVEKQVTLAIAKELQRQMNAIKGFRGELTRTGDYYIPLRERSAIARRKNADLFVSIHADAVPQRTAYGASVYALSDRGATSETARWLANTENQSDLIGGAGDVSLDDKDKMVAGVLLDLSMTSTLASSLNVGQKVLSNIGKMTRLHKSHVEQAAFMVLKSPDIPSILVETGFISTPSEARNLLAASYQKRLARAILTGIQEYFKQNPVPGS